MFTDSLPPWLLSAIDQRLAVLEHELPPGIFEASDHIITPLSVPPLDHTPEDHIRWERSCDCCNTHCPEHGQPPFYITSIELAFKNKSIVVTFGVCDDCAKSLPNYEERDQ